MSEHMLMTEISTSRAQDRQTVVVSQPMYFPWVGQLEQVRLADTFVFYDDVQFVRGFFNRVQIKTDSGSRWMTVPSQDQHRGQLINETQIDERVDWRRSHLDSFRQAYAGAAFLTDALDLISTVFARPVASLADLSIASTLALVRYFGLDVACNFLQSSRLGVAGHGTQRLIDICAAEQARTYLTGHGARNYLDCTAFDARGIDVAFIEYECAPYTQLHGAFTPYVTALDLVAHCGPRGRDLILGRPVPWRDFIEQQKSEQGKE